MARSKPKYRVKKTGSCPCVQEGGTVKEMEKDYDRVSPEEPRFLQVHDLYNPNDEYVDLESYSEVSSVDDLPADSVTLGMTTGMEPPTGVGDQMGEESLFLSGGTVSSFQPEDSEPNEGTLAENENRRLNIAATVMSWLDNYGQARGYTLGSHGTSLIIQADELSRRGSGRSMMMELDEAEASTSTAAPSRTIKALSEDPVIQTNEEASSAEDFKELEAACSIIINCHNDLQPLATTRTGTVWRKVQDVLSTWVNLMSTVWSRSGERRSITRGELFTFVRLCQSLESLALAVSPIDTSNFINPVIRTNLSRIQGFINLTLKWCKEIQTAWRIENGGCEGFNDNNRPFIITSWTDSMKQISTESIEQLRNGTKTIAGGILELQSVHSKFPCYEILLHDVIPTKTATGWMFFGRVELKHLVQSDYNGGGAAGSSSGSESSSSHASVQVIVRPGDPSALDVIFMASLPKMIPCIDYGAIFHIVSRASLECSLYYRDATQDFLDAKLRLSTPLLPPSYPKAFVNTTTFGQYMMMELVLAQILADQCLEPTVTAIDEILRSFSVLVLLLIKILTKFVKRIRIEQQPLPSEEDSPFMELTVPMATDANTLVFHTVRRFLSLGPLNFTACSGGMQDDEDPDQGKSALNAVHKSLERGINHLYETSERNVFSFHQGIQVLFAISQLVSADEFVKGAALERPMRALVLDRLNDLSVASREARQSFKQLVRAVDKSIKMTEEIIDKITKKGTKMGVMVPTRTSGVSLSHRHGRYILIRYRRNSYIRHQAKRLRQSHELRRHTRKYVVEPDYESGGNRSSRSMNGNLPGTAAATVIVAQSPSEMR